MLQKKKQDTNIALGSSKHDGGNEKLKTKFGI